MLVNSLKPTIFIPSSLANHNDIELLLEHELIHYKKKHLALKCLVLSANIVHWFNPMMYWMMRSFNEDCELVCDEILLNNKDKEYRQSYGKAILNCISMSKSKPFVIFSAFSSPKKTLKNRCSAIMNCKNRKRGITVALCICLIMCISLSMLTACDNKFNLLNSKVDFSSIDS